MMKVMVDFIFNENTEDLGTAMRRVVDSKFENAAELLETDTIKSELEKLKQNLEDVVKHRD